MVRNWWKIRIFAMVLGMCECDSNLLHLSIHAKNLAWDKIPILLMFPVVYLLGNSLAPSDSSSALIVLAKNFKSIFLQWLAFVIDYSWTVLILIDINNAFRICLDSTGDRFKYYIDYLFEMFVHKMVHSKHHHGEIFLSTLFLTIVIQA